MAGLCYDTPQVKAVTAGQSPAIKGLGGHVLLPCTYPGRRQRGGAV